MPMTNVPKPDDFYNKADKLFFDSFMSLINNFLYSKYKDNICSKLTPTDNFFIINLLHQSNECYLKGKICETSPYLLISELRSNDFLDCFTIEAGKLFNILNKIEPDFLIDEDFKKIYEKNKKSRNINIHSSELDTEIVGFYELMKEFLVTYSIFRPDKDFNSLFYTHIVNKFDKYNKNNKKISNNSLHFIYMRIIFELFLNEENNNSSINSKILKILKLPTEFKKSTYRYFCPNCVKLNEICHFNKPEPNLNDFNNNKILIFKTLYKKDINSYSCFCCNTNFKISRFKEVQCIACISTGGRKNTFHYNNHCLECNLNIDLPYHKFAIDFLKYGFKYDTSKILSKYSDSNCKPNFKCFDENTLKNRYEDLDKLLKYDKKTCIKFSKSVNFVTNTVINLCTGYYIFYLMDKSNINDNLLYTNDYKKQFYEQHRFKYTENETYDYIYKSYHRLFKFIVDKSGKKYKIKELEIIEDKFNHLVLGYLVQFIYYYYRQ